MEMLTYFLKANVLLSVFTLLYITMFRKETHFHLNRYFLLIGMISAILIPVIKIPIQSMESIQIPVNEFAIPEFVEESLSFLTPVETVKKGTEISLFSVLKLIYFAGIVILGFRFFLFIVKLLSLIQRGALSRIGKTFFVATNQHVQPFSFFNFIFFSAENAATRNFKTIVAHENVHVRQLHTVDLLFIEILVIVFWFNPFVFLLRNAVRANHEFLADAAVINRGTDRLEYMQTLAVQATSNQFGGFGSHFKSSTLKNRIVMITKKRSNFIKSLKYLLVFPLLGILISAFGLRENSIENVIVPNVNLIPLESLSQTKDEATFIQPIRQEDLKRIASGWGYRIHPIYKVKKFHYGQDYAATKGTDVVSMAAGKVREVNKPSKKTGYGNFIIVDHADGFSSLYAQLSGFNVKVGDNVNQGDVIGYVGSSGMSTAPHLHLELKKDGKHVNPADFIEKQ